MSNKVIPNVQTHGRYNVIGFVDELDSGGSGDEANKKPQQMQKNAKSGGGGQSASAKKRAKKKKAKQQQQHQESAELRNMAFSKLASVPRARTQSNSSEGGGNVGGLSNFSSTDEQRMAGGRPEVTGGANVRKAERKPEQWEQWKVQDQGFVENQYESDLQKAILQSKLKFEQEKLFYNEIKQAADKSERQSPQQPSSPHKQSPLPQNPLFQAPKATPLHPGHKAPPPSLYQRMDQLEEFDTLHDEPEPPPQSPPPPSAGGSKKEKKKHGKNKQHAMSLQEFQTGSTENGVAGGDSASQHKKSSSISEEDKHFFDKVDQDVANIMSKDHIKKARKQNEKFVAENARRVQYEDQLEQKDKVISGLKDVIEKLKGELSQVKKRNKQLCFILAQGEMKDKADVLKQVEDLTSVKDELTTEVAELHGSLEQERSKVSSLKSELQKLQDRKK